MYVGMTRAKKHLKLYFTRSRNLYGEVQSNAPSRFLDDLPDAQIERRSDELLSAFAWATESGRRKAFGGGKVETFRQNLDVEFNQDLGNDDVSQEPEFAVGMRIAHPSFGEGTIIALRGDVATITFDSGQKKTFALSIAPLRKID
jgi:DNA helicase-2/ATP-dependent DNA helicase PcrA